MTKSGADGRPVINFKPWGATIDNYQEEGAFQTYNTCGSAALLQISQIDNPKNSEKPL